MPSKGAVNISSCMSSLNSRIAHHFHCKLLENEGQYGFALACVIIRFLDYLVIGASDLKNLSWLHFMFLYFCVPVFCCIRYMLLR